MQINTYLRLIVHQNDPENLGLETIRVKSSKILGFSQDKCEQPGDTELSTHPSIILNPKF